MELIDLNSNYPHEAIKSLTDLVEGQEDFCLISLNIMIAEVYSHLDRFLNE
jgi:hypothetical protein